ncbi:MAG TPA: hypothetical protein VK668_22905 [Mucilaginibacter sp.]|nr:hypothetical protein [Mucilaginibacter sp.]
MKKFLISLSVFLLAAFVTQYVVYTVFKKVLDSKSKFRITRYFRSPKHKYFVLGNSRGVNSINEKYATEKLKLDIINLSFNGMPYQNMAAILTDVNSKNTNAVIFVEISCLNNNEFDNSYSYYSSNSTIIKKQFSGSVYNMFNLLRLDNELFLRNIYYLKKSDNDWVNNYTITQSIIDKIKTDTSFKIAPNKDLFATRLAELQKTCNDHGNRLVYFLAPYYPGYLYKISDYNSVLSYMSENSKTYQFINLNKEKMTDDMFADRLHTNVKGSVLLTTDLVALSK